MKVGDLAGDVDDDHLNLTAEKIGKRRPRSFVRNADDIKAVEYFSGKRFGTELGTVDYQIAKTASEELDKAGKPAIDVRTFNTYADVLQALAAKRWFRFAGSP